MSIDKPGKYRKGEISVGWGLTRIMWRSGMLSESWKNGWILVVENKGESVISEKSIMEPGDDDLGKRWIIYTYWEVETFLLTPSYLFLFRSLPSHTLTYNIYWIPTMCQALTPGSGGQRLLMLYPCSPAHIDSGQTQPYYKLITWTITLDTF